MKPSRFNSLIAASLVAAAPSVIHAADATWSSAPTDALWSTDANWNEVAAPGAVGTTTNTDTANFTSTSSTIKTITVDAGRNIGSMFLPNSAFYRIGSAGANAGEALHLSSGGQILTNSSSSDTNIDAPLILEGDGGTYTFVGDMTASANREISINGSVTGVSTTDNTTTLTLTGGGSGSNALNSAVSDGANGGKLAVVKNGTGLWIYNGAKTYTGGTTVNDGQLRLNNSGSTVALVPGTITITGGTLRMQNSSGNTFDNELVANGGGFSFRANSNFSPPAFTGTGPFTISGDSGITVSTTNFQGFAGTLNIGSGSNLILRLVSGYEEGSLANAAVHFAEGASLTRNFGTNGTRITQIGTLSGDAGATVGGSAPGGGVFIIQSGSRNESSTFSGSLVDGSTKSGLDKIGTGTLTLDGANTYTGDTTVTDGTLVLADTGSLSFAVGATSSNSISGSGTLQLDGTLTLDLSAASTVIDDTWLLVNNTSFLSATYGVTFAVASTNGAFTFDSGVWTRNENGVGYEFDPTTGLLTVVEASGGGYSTWASANAGGQDPDEDFDLDGVSNGVEFFLGETGSGFTANPQLSGGTVTWPNGGNIDSGSYGTAFIVQTSPDLGTWTDVLDTDPALVNAAGSVTYTPATGEGKVFVRLKVTPN